MSALDWIPPAGMLPKVITTWRAFYRRIELRYGITPAEYRALYLAQLGRCYICQTARGVHPDDPKGKGTRRLGVDHNHLMRGRDSVRGLLCTGSIDPKTCNRLIAHFPHAALRRAVAYVEESPAQAVFARLAEGAASDEELTGMALR